LQKVLGGDTFFDSHYNAYSRSETGQDRM